VGNTGNVSPTFSDGGDIIWHVPPHFSIYVSEIWKSFKNKSDVCHVLCEELFIFDAAHSQVDVETDFGVALLIP